MYLISSNMYLVINVLTSCILFMILSNAYYIDISGSGDRDNSKHKNMFSVIDSGSGSGDNTETSESKNVFSVIDSGSGSGDNTETSESKNVFSVIDSGSGSNGNSER
ncbi:hypothetical protein [Magpiepox virus]|nr:hypothetical protein [Magpiepox virus]